MAIDQKDLRSLVDWEHGLIGAEIFIDEGIYRQELKMLFGRAWLFLAHDSMIPSPGDFLNTYMGGDPVIVARQKDGSVKAYLNACRHRGMKVCRAEDGNARNFMCTYHGWTYDIAGNLINVPNLDDAYHNELDTSRWGLLQVAQIDNYKGLWFATFDTTAPSLLDYLGDSVFYIDAWLDHAARRHRGAARGGQVGDQRQLEDRGRAVRRRRVPRAGHPRLLARRIQPRCFQGDEARPPVRGPARTWNLNRRQRRRRAQPLRRRPAVRLQAGPGRPGARVHRRGPGQDPRQLHPLPQHVRPRRPR